MDPLLNSSQVAWASRKLASDQPPGSKPAFPHSFFGLSSSRRRAMPTVISQNRAYGSVHGPSCHVPSFTSNLLVSSCKFYSQICHHIFTGLQFYDYYDFICRLLIHISLSPEFLGNLMSLLHSYHINSPSPGKNNTYFTTRLPSVHIQFYVKDIGFRWSGAPCPSLHAY